MSALQLLMTELTQEELNGQSSLSLLNVILHHTTSITIFYYIYYISLKNQILECFQSMHEVLVSILETAQPPVLQVEQQNLLAIIRCQR